MKKELLFSVTKKDLEISYYSGHGPGGQKRNKCKNCVRINHPDSGAMVTAQEERSKDQNLKNAFHRLIEHPKFIVWHKRKTWEILNKKTIEQLVEEQMASRNIKIEMLEEGKWVAWHEDNNRSDDTN